jgi:hypothetical protein
MLFSNVCPPFTLKLNRAAEMPDFAHPLAMDQCRWVKSSDGLWLPHEEGACLSPSLFTEKEQEQDLFHG